MSENSETKWTPGPWRHDAINHQIRTGVATGKRFEGECIGSVNPLCPELIANAQLIAAAPDLYTALARLIAELPTKRDWLDPVLEAQAKDALRSARGTR